ncbi:52 kDa repressor of the inhibitor of the protein kinase-like [Diabrotica virgifera virgifera]|uniref:THAP-type domain-containing protein n=1 Tax=Diabrotica virgifera virgifera TaxID=50390 RepID=A0ABM5KZR5_DIAVI|nr:52 kDa repressor of the inhibitor of the protein kinase-like [Diabrotica virgifera virgifera]
MSKIRTGISRCSAKMCTNNSKNCNYSFFRFPKEADRARNWAMLCQREDLLKKTNLNLNRLCSVHFENTMFSNKTRNRLCKNAVPRLFPSIEDSPNQHSNVDQGEFICLKAEISV